MHIPEPITATVLLIDAQDKMAKEQAIFEAHGFTVLSANTTEAGLRMVNEQRPDVVVSEVMLERPDAGFVLAYRMKNNPALADIPLVLLSSIFQKTGTVMDLSTPESRQWIKADVYLERPVTPDHLVAKVCAVINQPHAMA